MTISKKAYSVDSVVFLKEGTDLWVTDFVLNTLGTQPAFSGGRGSIAFQPSIHPRVASLADFCYCYVNLGQVGNLAEGKRRVAYRTDRQQSSIEASFRRRLGCYFLGRSTETL